MKILHEVCSLPTAPFVEDRVIAYAREFAKARKLKLTQDRFGNLLLELRGTQRNAPRIVFTAHMDHPGFVAGKMLDKRTLQAIFRGYVLAEYLQGQKIRFFVGDEQITGVVTEATPEKKSPRAERALIRVKKEVPPNSAGMFDQGESRVKGGKFYSRAIDDLAGLAAALDMLDRLAKHQGATGGLPARGASAAKTLAGKLPVAPKSTVAVLLTRAEEEGFVGAIAASLHPQLLRKTDLLIAIECSAMQSFARQGDGCIIRIGDRTSVFNSSLSYFIAETAAALAKKDKSFKSQRALMPGGTCEATVYDVYGFTAGSICVPLGNYHNMDRDQKKIAPEYIDPTDWQNMVKLFLAVARNAHTYQPGHQLLKRKLEDRFGKLKDLL